jgi:hypothetical protein
VATVFIVEAAHIGWIGWAINRIHVRQRPVHAIMSQA